jgi:hypothetical protein
MQECAESRMKVEEKNKNVVLNNIYLSTVKKKNKIRRDKESKELSVHLQ